MDKKETTELIKDNQKHSQDTGSAFVQVALLKQQIIVLSQHLKKNIKDVVARRILLKKVAKHKKLLKSPLFLHPKNTLTINNNSQN